MIKYIIVIILVLILGTYGYLYLYSDIAPKFAEVERQVFEQTQSYTQGKITYLTRLKFDYECAKDYEVRQSLRNMIIIESSTIDLDRLPLNLQTFIKGL